jgi:hypothetical protein
MGMVVSEVAAFSETPASEDTVVLAADIDLGDMIMAELLDMAIPSYVSDVSVCTILLTMSLTRTVGCSSI